MLIEANPRYDEDDNFLIYTLKETWLVKELLFVQGIDLAAYFKNQYEKIGG